jgi:acetyl-CoA carboxylase carboxyl transferase subunit beta
VPTVSVLLGQGSGGAALALLPADRVIAAEHAWLSPLPPEGASAIVHHDTAHAPLMAERQKVSAFDLLDAGVVHVVVPERPAAHEDPQAFAHTMLAACVAAIRDATSASRRALRPLP